MNLTALSLASATVLLTVGCSSGSNSSAMDDSGLIIVDGSPADDNTTNPSQPSVPLDAIRAQVLNELAGYQAESLAEIVYELATNIEATTTSVQLPGTVVETEVVSFTEPSTRNSFDCHFGGTMVRVSDSTHESLGGGTTETNEYEFYEFDQCVIGLSDGSQADGNYELNGSYTFETYRRSTNRGGLRNIVATWDIFNLRHVDGVAYEFDGSLTLALLSTPSAVQTTRDSRILRYLESRDDMTTVELNDVEFYQRRRPIQFAEHVEGTRELRVNGTYIGPPAQGETLQVNTNIDFTESISSSAESNEPLTGSLQMTSTDGGVLTMIANGPLAVSFISTDGTAKDSILEELPVFDILGPGCIPGGGFFDTIEIESCLF